MAVQVKQIQKKENAFGKLLGPLGTLVGGAVGFLSGGGTAGAGLGASIGGSLGSVGGNLASSGGGGPTPVPTGENAFARKLEAQSDDKLAQLMDSARTIPELPKEQRIEFAKPIFQAIQLESRKTRSFA